jgi:hypothetical protein
MWMAQGEGGQRLFIIPALRLVIAMTCGNYEKEDQGVPPTRVLREVVLASIVYGKGDSLIDKRTRDR